MADGEADWSLQWRFRAQQGTPVFSDAIGPPKEVPSQTLHPHLCPRPHPTGKKDCLTEPTNTLDHHINISFVFTEFLPLSCRLQERVFLLCLDRHNQDILLTGYIWGVKGHTCSHSRRQQASPGLLRLASLRRSRCQCETGPRHPPPCFKEASASPAAFLTSSRCAPCTSGFCSLHPTKSTCLRVTHTFSRHEHSSSFHFSSSHCSAASILASRGFFLTFLSLCFWHLPLLGLPLS